MINSAASFGLKLGAGIGAGLIGFMLSLGRYDSVAATQSSSAITSILTVSIYIPMVLLFAMFCYGSILSGAAVSFCRAD